MSQQRINFNNNRGAVSIFNGSSVDESRTDSVTMKCTSTEKRVLEEIAKQDRCANSEFVRAATAFYIEFRLHAEKMLRHKETVLYLLDKLP